MVYNWRELKVLCNCKVFTTARIMEECEEHGLSELDIGLKLRAALIHFRNELAENNLVGLKKTSRPNLL